MGEVFKISKDKRHRSSSSLAGVALEGTRSERKLEINVSIPEVEDQFAVAEKRCDNLQDKINLIQSLKRKKKLKKRSMTKVIEQPETSPKNIPSISVRTFPKKTSLIPEVSPQAVRTRRLEMQANHPTRGYLDPATVEQHRMIGQVRGYNNAFNRPNQERNTKITDHKTSRSRLSGHQRFKAEGDSLSGHEIQEDSASIDGARRNNDRYYNNDYDDYDRQPEKNQDSRHNIKLPSTRRRRVPIEDPIVQEKPVELSKDNSSLPMPKRWLSTKARKSSGTMSTPPLVPEPVVELFNKHYGSAGFDKQSTLSPPSPPRNQKTVLTNNNMINQPVKMTPVPQHPRKVHPRRVKYKSRRYELPTVASQMKQAGLRYYYDTNNHTNIPFVVSKSTAPSHNIGVNIQQVLNGLKMQQPLSGIPLTIAYHMGLSHVPSHGTKSAAAVLPESQERAINAIKVGRRMLRLPSYKYMSYKRLLTLYREGDGIVPRFLKAMSRPHYFYTSLYNLATNREDFDATTSKGNITSLETKQNIAQFAGLYREYEKLNKYCKEGNYDHKLELRKEELSKELIAREHKLRKVLQEYRPALDLDQPLRASASTVEDTYRHSKYKLDADDSPQ